MRAPDVARQYSFTAHNEVHLPRINKTVSTYIIEHRSQDSFESGHFNLDEEGEEEDKEEV